MLLGQKRRDTVTGFEGVVTAVCERLDGYLEAEVQPPLDAKGAFQDSRWFPLTRLERAPEPPAPPQPAPSDTVRYP